MHKLSTAQIREIARQQRMTRSRANIRKMHMIAGRTDG